MKTVRMQGGLGNQLFCLALARSIQRKTGEQVALDLGSYGADRFGNSFKLTDLVERLDGLSLCHRPVLGSRYMSALLRQLPFALPGHIIEATPPAWNDLDTFARLGSYFDGYWQDERYIDDPNGLTGLVRAVVEDRALPRPSARVAFHYRTYKEEGHPVRSRTPGSDYFIAALAELEARIGRLDHVSLVSDDPALAMERIGPIGVEIRPVTGGGPFDDMAYLMRADALVLTNSSFSWWAAYCGRAETVIYPERQGLYHYPSPARRFVVL